MAPLNEAKLRTALVERGLCDRETALSVTELCQEIWAEATDDFATDNKIALAISDLRSGLMEVINESERLQIRRHDELRREINDLRREVAERDQQLRRDIADRDEQLRREIADRDAGYREDQAARDNRTQWLIGMGFTAFGVLASVLAVLT